MNTDLINEALIAVRDINETLEEQLHDEKYGMDPWVYMELQTDISNGVVVMFLGERLWSSEDDEREWTDGEWVKDEEMDSSGYMSEGLYESLEPYLKRKANKLITKLQKIKL